MGTFSLANMDNGRNNLNKYMMAFIKMGGVFINGMQLNQSVRKILVLKN